MFNGVYFAPLAGFSGVIIVGCVSMSFLGTIFITALTVVVVVVVVVVVTTITGFLQW